MEQGKYGLVGVRVLGSSTLTRATEMATDVNGTYFLLFVSRFIISPGLVGWESVFFLGIESQR